MKGIFFTALIIGVTAGAAVAADDVSQPGSEMSPSATELRPSDGASSDISTSTGTDARGYGFSARLVDQESRARRGEAEVQVGVTNFDIADPALTRGELREGQGHIHYRLDNGPDIETTNTKIGFHNLSPGPHTIDVSLVSNDHSVIATQSLSVTVPSARLEGDM